jgi:hypothetical protein
MGRVQGDAPKTLLERPFFLNRHQTPALLKERELFLTQLQQPGTGRKALRNVSGELLQVSVSSEADQNAICVAGGNPASGAPLGAPATRESKGTFLGNSASFFVYAAKKWLRFHGRRKLPSAPPTRFADQLSDFAR